MSELGLRAWTPASVGSAEQWTLKIDGEVADQLTARAASAGDGISAAPELERQLRAALEHERGFVVVQPPDAWQRSASSADARALYLGVGTLIGRPIVQDLAGTLLYDVIDTGAAVNEGARFSITSEASSFHTDGAFMPVAPDYVGLLCLETGLTGGTSQLVSGHSLTPVLTAASDVLDVLGVLSKPFLFDRRGEQSVGEEPTWETPVWHVEAGGRVLTIRYLAYYIEVGHQAAGRPLRREQQAALEAMDAALNRPELQLEFELHRGQMLFTNNRWILHNRTAFEDHPNPERRRHLVRLWLAK